MLFLPDGTQLNYVRKVKAGNGLLSKEWGDFIILAIHKFDSGTMVFP